MVANVAMNKKKEQSLAEEAETEIYPSELPATGDQSESLLITVLPHPPDIPPILRTGSGLPTIVTERVPTPRRTSLSSLF